MEQTLYANDFLSLKKRGNYIYSHESRSDGKLVAVLVYDSSRPDAVLGRYEICPAHDDPSPQLCAITGGVENGRPSNRQSESFERKPAIAPMKWIWIHSVRFARRNPLIHRHTSTPSTRTARCSTKSLGTAANMSGGHIASGSAKSRQSGVKIH